MNREVQILRETIVAITKILGDKRIPVTQIGTKAYVEHDDKGNPIRVNIPSVPDDASPDLLAAIQGFIDHEVGHLLFSDFKILGLGISQGVGAFHNLIEDTFVERKMCQRFRGSEYNLDQVSKFFLGRVTETEYNEAVASGDKRKILGSMLVALIRAESGQRLFSDWCSGKISQIQDFYDSLPKSFWDGLRTANSTQECLDLAHELAKAVSNYLKPPPPPPQPPMPPQPPQEECEEGDQGNDDEEGQPGNGQGSNGDGDEDDADDQEGDSGSGDAAQDEDDSEGDDENGNKSSENGSNDDGEDEDEGDSSASDDADEDDAEDQENGLNPEGDGGDADQEEGEGDSEGSDGDSGDDDGDSGDDGDEGDSSDDGDADGQDGDSDDGDANTTNAGQTDENRPADKAVDWEKDPEGEDKGQGARQEHGMAASVEEEGDELTDEEKAMIEAALKEIMEQMGDFDEKLAEAISEYARDCNDASNYSVFTREDDVIETFTRRQGLSAERVAEISRKMSDRVDHMLGTIQKDIERTVVAKTVCRKLPGQRRGRLNPSSLHKLAVGAVRPDLRDDRVFYRKEEHTGKDIAVSLLVDGSGSMNGSPIMTACDTAYAMSAVLDRLGIANEVLCFTTRSLRSDTKQQLWDEVNRARSANVDPPTWTRLEGLNIQILKGYDERMVPQVKDRFALYPHTGEMRCNIDGECVEIGARRLLARQEHGKLMMVLSDGQPAGCETHYSAIPAHLKQVVKNVMKAGVNLVGIGIETDVVMNYYPKHVVLHRIKDLPELVMRQLKQAILSSSH